MKLNSQIVFKSKRNTVRLSHQHVEKIHISAESAKFEADRLTHLYSKGLAVPRVITLNGEVIIMEYIKATPLPDMIDHWEQNPDPAAQKLAMESVVVWLFKYYEILEGESRGDINGRNFLFDGEKLWGVDFEERGIDTPLVDIGRLCAFILSYEPAHTQLKKELVEIIIKQSGLDHEQVLQEQEKSLEFLKQRRNGNYL